MTQITNYTRKQLKEMGHYELDKLAHWFGNIEKLTEEGCVDYIIEQQHKYNGTGITTFKGAKIGRNQKCTCGSMRKYKHCCGKNK